MKLRGAAGEGKKGGGWGGGVVQPLVCHVRGNLMAPELARDVCKHGGQFLSWMRSKGRPPGEPSSPWARGVPQHLSQGLLCSVCLEWPRPPSSSPYRTGHITVSGI